MRKTTLFFAAGLLTVLTIVNCKAPAKQQEARLDKLSWILNTWERTNVRPGTTAFETWEKKSDQLYTGMGVSLKGTDTTFVEQLRIEMKDDKLYYVADVRENATPTYFLITEINEQGFKSENPDHDFPKVIMYELKDGVLTAIISDGGDKKMGFVFKKK
jgi:hypothetical protein